MDKWVTMQADMEEVKDDTPPPPPPPPPADFEPPPLEVPPSPDLPALVDAPAPANSIQIESRPVQEVKPVVVERPPLVPPTKAVNFFRKNKPPYPSASRRLQEEGSVITQITLAADGTASCTVAESSGTPRLDEAVTKWCATKKFDPATRGGSPESFTFKLKYTFRLEDE
jgi:protein TonB